MGARHTFTEPRTPIALDALPTIPEWKMTTAEWIAHQQRLYGPNWRAEIDRMDGEAADAAWREWFGDVPVDYAPDLSAHARSTAMMPGVS